MKALRPTAADDLDSWAPVAMAIFWGFGSVLAIVVTLLPGREDRLVSGLISLSGCVAAVVMSTAGRRLTIDGVHRIAFLGSLAVAGGAANAVDSFGPDGVLFVWGGLYAGFFLNRGQALQHIAFIGLLYGLLLGFGAAQDIPVAFVIQGWVLVVGSVLASAMFSSVLRQVVESLIERQRRLASTDALTGLGNRAELLRRGTDRVARPGTWAMLLLDLDDFKVVNDAEGHAAGDRLLCEVARRIAGVARDDDLVVRLGGDEFAVLLEHAGHAEAEAAAERLHRALAGPHDGPAVACSIGVAVAVDGDRTAQDLLRDADLAMYAAKQAGVGWRGHTKAMHDEVARWRLLQQELERGLEKRLHVVFQPILDIDGEHCVGVEALARWSHPELGDVSPATFIPIAERAGLIVRLGRRVLHESCRQAAAWPATHGVEPLVSVNLSPRQLLDPGLVDAVGGALAQHGLAPERLMLEITESTVMVNPEESVSRLRELRALGVRLAVDDFGTGHSSLAYLQRLPVTDLKLAREFTSALETSPRDLALARGIVALGRALELRVIAEGVETPLQLAHLREMGCDLAQGFLLARPMAPGAWEAFLLDRSDRAAEGAAHPLGVTLPPGA